MNEFTEYVARSPLDVAAISKNTCITFNIGCLPFDSACDTIDKIKAKYGDKNNLNIDVVIKPNGEEVNSKEMTISNKDTLPISNKFSLSGIVAGIVKENYYFLLDCGYNTYQIYVVDDWKVDIQLKDYLSLNVSLIPVIVKKEKVAYQVYQLITVFPRDLMQRMPNSDDNTNIN